MKIRLSGVLLLALLEFTSKGRHQSHFAPASDGKFSRYRDAQPAESALWITSVQQRIGTKMKPYKIAMGKRQMSCIDEGTRLELEHVAWKALGRKPSLVTARYPTDSP